MSMEEKNPSKLPMGWIHAKIIDICQLVNGRAFKPTDWSCDGLPIIRIQNLNNSNAPYNYCQSTVDPKFHVDHGQLLFAWSGTPETSFGAHIWKKGKALLNQHIFKVEIDEAKVSKPFLMHLMNHNVREYVRKAHGTAGLAHITKSKFENSTIPLPPFNEQHRIVSKIEELFTKLDAGVEELRKAKARLRRYRQAVLQAAVTGELTRQWREKKIGKMEPADNLLSRILDAHLKEWEKRELVRISEGGKQSKGSGWKEKYRPPKGVNDPELPELPMGWAWVTVEQLAAAEDHSMIDGPFGSNLKTEHYTSDGPRVIRLQNIGSCEFIDEKAHISTDRFQWLKKHAVYGGDIVIRSLGLPSPTACMVPDWVGEAIVKADCFRYKVAEQFVNPKYVMYALNSPSTQKRTEALVHGVGRPRLNLNEVKSIPLPLPPLEEQMAIVGEVESCLSIMDQVSSSIHMNLKRIETLRQTILKKAFSGELIRQDPNDEPAEKLLERIRESAIKVTTTKKKRKSNGETPNGK